MRLHETAYGSAMLMIAVGSDFVEEDSCHHPSYTNNTLIPYRDLWVIALNA